MVFLLPQWLLFSLFWFLLLSIAYVLVGREGERETREKDGKERGDRNREERTRKERENIISQSE